MVCNIGCKIIVDDVFFLAQLHNFKNILKLKTFFEKNEKINISMNLFLGQGDVGFHL